MGGLLSRRGKGTVVAVSSSSSDGNSSDDTSISTADISDSTNTTVVVVTAVTGDPSIDDAAHAASCNNNTFPLAIALNGGDGCVSGTMDAVANWHTLGHEYEKRSQLAAAAVTTISSPPTTLIPRIIEPFNVAYNNKDAIVAWLQDIKSEPVVRRDDDNNDLDVMWEDVMSVIADNTAAAEAATTVDVTKSEFDLAKLHRYSLSPRPRPQSSSSPMTTVTVANGAQSTLTALATIGDRVSSQRAVAVAGKSHQQRSSIVTDGKCHIRRLQSIVRDCGGGSSGGGNKRGPRCSSRCQGVDGHVRTCVNKRNQNVMKDYIMGCTLRSAMNCKHCKTRNVFKNRLQFWNYNGSRDVGANNIRVAINCAPDDQGADIHRT